MKLVMQERRIDKLMNEEDLNTSEKSFLNSLKHFIRTKGRLSSKQWSAFQKVEYRHSPAFLQDKKAWIDSWDADKARKARIAAEYYLTISLGIRTCPGYSGGQRIYTLRTGL